MLQVRKVVFLGQLKKFSKIQFIYVQVQTHCGSRVVVVVLLVVVSVVLGVVVGLAVVGAGTITGLLIEGA